MTTVTFLSSYSKRFVLMLETMGAQRTSKLYW